MMMHDNTWDVINELVNCRSSCESHPAAMRGATLRECITGRLGGQSDPPPPLPLHPFSLYQARARSLSLSPSLSLSLPDPVYSTLPSLRAPAGRSVRLEKYVFMVRRHVGTSVRVHTHVIIIIIIIIIIHYSEGPRGTCSKVRGLDAASKSVLAARSRPPRVLTASQITLLLRFPEIIAASFT
jgi:hypothetical protein